MGNPSKITLVMDLKNSKANLKGKPRAKKTVCSPENGFTYFLVKTKGYKKQFTNEEAARRKFAALEKKKTEAEEAFKIELSARKDLKSEWVELDFVQVSDFVSF